ncbi:MAG TPA: hypothetical protein VGM80_01435 [Gaiellaceae bacterium]
MAIAIVVLCTGALAPGALGQGTKTNGPASAVANGNGKSAKPAKGDTPAPPASNAAHGAKASPPHPPAVAAAGAGPQTAQGVVQTVTPAVVVIKQLDGKAVSVPYDKKTHFFLDRKPTRVGEVKAGFVLVAAWTAGKPATTLRFVRSG